MSCAGRLAGIFRRRIPGRSGAASERTKRPGREVRPAAVGNGDGSRNHPAEADQTGTAARARHTKYTHPKYTHRPAEPILRAGRHRRYAGFRRFRAKQSSTHRRQRTGHQRRGSERVARCACRRGAGSGAGPDRDPAFRRRQSQPILFARLQSRPRHRSRHHRRWRAGQHADARPRPGLRRHQFPDSGIGQAVNVRKGPYFADKGDFASGGCRRHRLPQQAAEEHRPTHIRQLRLPACARGRLGGCWRWHAARSV